MFDHRATLILAALLVCGTPFSAQVTGADSHLNDTYVDPDLDVQTWVERFEGESREVFVARHAVLKASGVEAGDRVADIGAGTGLYTRLFAEAVGETGWVHAVDISTAFLQHINRTTAESGMNNVTAVLGQLDSITLPPDSVDLAFVCDTYHHLEQVGPMLASIRRALVSKGRLIVVEFDRVPGKSRQWILDHTRAGKEVFRAEIEAAGFTFVEEVEIPGFVENYFLKFEKK
jgi:predicted methyltransferase